MVLDDLLEIEESLSESQSIIEELLEILEKKHGWTLEELELAEDLDISGSIVRSDRILRNMESSITGFQYDYDDNELQMVMNFND